MIDFAGLTGEITDPKEKANALQALERIADFFERINDPYRMPELMVEYYNKQRQSGVDTYYQCPVGFGYEAMSLRMTFRKNQLELEFFSPDGTRLMELRLHV